MQYHTVQLTDLCQYLYCRRTVQIIQVYEGYIKISICLHDFSSLILLQNLFFTLMKRTFYEILNLLKQPRDFDVFHPVVYIDNGVSNN
jgi:hypothetical protein